MIDFEMVLDWKSIGMNGYTVGLCAISGNQVLYVLGGVATLSTIIYNLIRIYKELKRPTK